MMQGETATGVSPFALPVGQSMLLRSTRVIPLLNVCSAQLPSGQFLVIEMQPPLHRADTQLVFLRDLLIAYIVDTFAGKCIIEACVASLAVFAKQFGHNSMKSKSYSRSTGIYAFYLNSKPFPGSILTINLPPDMGIQYLWMTMQASSVSLFIYAACSNFPRPPKHIIII